MPLLHQFCDAGGLSGKGKIPYAILALMDAIRHHPGQVGVCHVTICHAQVETSKRSPAAHADTGHGRGAADIGLPLHAASAAGQ